MADAFEHLDAGLWHIPGKLTRKLDIAAHFAAQSFRRESRPTAT